MEESNYKHNYEYLSIEEAKSIIGGTFVQGTTSIGGELATKDDIDRLLTAADKKLTSIVPVTDASDEFICFFECISNETFPDDLEHRWIEVSPIQFTFPADGGSVKITGSYGLTGTLGTRKKVGDIADTITAGANATPSTKSGSKIYHYNNDQSQTPTAKVSWTQPNKEEEFPDDEAHRWIRVQPESSQIPVDGGTINVTGSYGLTGTYGTEKKVGDITDTIVVESNSTQNQKSGSKTYHYNNNQSDTPTAEITWTQPGRAEEFPDDEAHRWIEITPTDAGNFTEAGGTITVTGSYGLTGSFGTKKTVGQINDTITVERNTTTQTKSGSKTYYYNNTPGTDPSATVTWTQDAHVESFTYKYYIYIGQNADTIQQEYMQLVWQSDQYNQSSKKSVFVKAYKQKINEQGLVVSTEDVEYKIRNNQSTVDLFSISNNVNNNVKRIDCFPIKENTSYSNKKQISFQLCVTEDESTYCNVILIQERKDVQVISGDAVMFTYTWDRGTDLDQATFINLNDPYSNDENYAGFSGRILDKYRRMLHFAGDNVGTGNEYAFIDFKEVTKYLNFHKDDKSTIAGKTILDSLVDDNGSISISCDLYSNWYHTKETEDIILKYTVYNIDSEDTNVEVQDKRFILTGYKQMFDKQYQALCYSKGKFNIFRNTNVKDVYTLSAKFTYYLNSGVFVLDTNKGNVGKWNKGIEGEDLITTPSYSNVAFTNDGENIKFSVNLDSLDYSEKFNTTDYISFNIEMDTTIENKQVYFTFNKVKLHEFPHKIEISVPLSRIIKEINFGGLDSITIYPIINNFDELFNYNTYTHCFVNPILFKKNTVVIQKPSV